MLVANGGEYVVTATAGAASNYQQNSTQTATITVTVNAIPITSLSYSSSRIDTSIGLAITDLTPTLDPSGATGTYSAALPAGLTVEPSSGKISGTPTAAVTTADYTVTFTADGDYSGTETADIKITVKTPVTGLSYSPASIDTSIGVDIGTLSPQPVPSGATGTYSGTLPDGLNLDPSSGEITGAPTTASSTSSYTVTFTADGDYSGTQSVDIDITVKTPVKSLSYSPSNLDTSIGVDIGELSPTLDPSGATGTYSVDPTLPDGLTLDESGKITGVPTTSAAVATTPVEYTVTFTATADGDYTGTKTATIQISVKKPNLNTAALGYSPASMSTTAKTANSTGISPNWTPAAGNIAVTQIIYSIAAATTGNNIPATDGADTTVSIDSSTGKVTLTAQVGVANSGEYVVTATAGANSNYLQGSTQTAAITVTVNAIPVTGLSYSTSSMDATIGTAIAVEATPTTVPSGATGTYSVDPALPNGLTLDESGKIGGTPTVLAAAVSHTVTFTADGDYSGTPTAAITISVKNPNLSTAVLNYSNQGTISADMGTASTITPDWTPATGNSDPTDISYSIAATTGINAPTTDGSTGANPGIEIDLTTGTVSITADAIIDNSGKYMITATAGASSNYLQGSTQNVFITVEVKLGSVSGLKPGDGQITANSNPTLSWNAVTGATSYDFQIAANDENAVTSAALQSLSSTEYTWTTTTLVNGNKLYWRVRAKDVSGRVGDWSDIVSMEFKGYSVGDTGPAGGYILYDKGSISDGWRYLEVAPTDVVVGQWNDRFIWGNSTGSLTLSSAVGAGKANTAAILKDIGNPEAASACDGAVYNSYDDWFLPASDTLIAMYNNRNTIGGFVTGNNAEYWSSSTSTAKNAVVVYFNDAGGKAIGGFSSEYGRARPVRTF